MIAILMATYNGEKYLREQLDSLFAQTVQDFHLYVSDDASTDSTVDIVRVYQARFPDRITLSQRTTNSGGAWQNYFGLMIACRDDYVMLCDQDDVWLPDKIAVTLDCMRTMEQRYGADTPLLVHTDLTLTDEKLRVTFPSYRRAMCSLFERTRLEHALIQNTFAGCSCMYNRALAELIYAAPAYCVMHDWWLMIVAAAFGHIGFSYQATALYRQHGTNRIGACDMSTLSYKLGRLLHPVAVKHAIDITYRQAREFLSMYHSRLLKRQLRLIQTYCRVPAISKPGKIITLLRLGTIKNTWTRRLGHFLFV